MQASHVWRGDGAVFDDHNLVSYAGLVPLLELAEQAGLSRLLDEHVRFASTTRAGVTPPWATLSPIQYEQAHSTAVQAG